MAKKVAIIGAGLTGLSAGIVLAQHGIESEIFEKAPWAGGVCTAWTRKGYTFDGCIHWMVGTKENEPMRKMYESVHALEPNTDIYHMESMILTIDKVEYHIPLTLPEFEAFLINIAPEDQVAIHRLCKEIQQIGKTELIGGTPKSLKDLIRAVTKSGRFLRILMKYLKVTVGTYCHRFTNPKIVAILSHLMPPPFSMFALIMMLGTRMAQNGGFPLGGSRDLIKRMQATYESLGGVIRLNTPIHEIIVKNQHVVALRSDQGKHPATHVIAACDMEDTLHRMLGRNHPHPVLERMLQEAPLFDPIMLVSLGLNQSFGVPSSAIYDFDQPFDVGGGKLIHQYHIRSFDFDPSFAPVGHSSVMVLISAPFDYWHQLRATNPTTYRNEKNAVAKRLIACLETKYPGITQAVEVIDVATPSTYHRLNNLYLGSYEGFLPLPQALQETIANQIPGIANLYLAGQWITPGGGIPPAILSGIQTAKQIIKAKANEPFRNRGT
jgi:phytoene desaturase